MVKKSKYIACLRYINRYWRKIIFHLPKDRGIFIGLPKSYVAPNNDIFKYDQFYWDSYFIILGLVKSRKISLAQGMVDNLLYLYKRFGIIPNRNRLYNLAISQIPFLTSMIEEVFGVNKNKTWLANAIKIAEKELNNYWMGKEHLIFYDLSRYCDHFMIHNLAEHESGWDMTSRFNERSLNFLPVDLNSCLYKYEIDLAKFYQILKQKNKAKYYLKRSEKRRKTMIKLMWNKKKRFFFDYNFRLKRQSSFWSLVGFYPLWAKLVTKAEAEEIKKNLNLFEYKGGLSNTRKIGLFNEFKQWDYPNGWPNQQWIVIRGLLNYDFKEEAKRIAKKWLDLNKKIFLKTGKFWEKYDVVKCDIGKSDERYHVQSGFGWTNAVFIRLIKELEI